MQDKFINDKVFKNEDYALRTLPLAEYDNCTFKTCNFKSVSLSNFRFTECVFEDCDFSLANLAQTVLNIVEFKTCKLLGLKFHQVDTFLLSLKFDSCNLKLSSFYKLILKNTLFIDCNLQEVDFTETNLQASNFKNCDLEAAVFDGSILEKVDFRTSYNYSIDPEKNSIKKAKFSVDQLPGLLRKYNIDID